MTLLCVLCENQQIPSVGGERVHFFLWHMELMNFSHFTVPAELVLIGKLGGSIEIPVKAARTAPSLSVF